jgi:hypothetical protein
VRVSVAALTILDLSKVNVALPSIEQALGAESTELQIVVSGYVLLFGLALVPFGRLGDQRSRKQLFIIGLSLFTVTSIVCAMAPTTEVLLAGRLVQGLRRHPDAAGHRHHPAAVHGQGARPRLRAVRGDDRDRHGVRPDARRPHDRARRPAGRLAIHLRSTFPCASPCSPA